MLEQKVYRYIIKYNLIENGDKIVLGVSGGPDSICMLNILYEISKKKLIDFEIVVAHINHGLRKNAILDENYVREFCKNKNIKCQVLSTDIRKVAQKNKKGLEETGRKIRYEFFDETMKQNSANKIATAHNKNDSAETIIMNFLRGSGIKGLTGIEAKSGKYIRPLIEIQRNEIEEYLKQNNIIARHDESNDDNIYTRNKIRNIVIPYIQKEFNSNIINSLERLSKITTEIEEYLNIQSKKIYEQICISESNITDDFEYNKQKSAEIIIDLKKFNELEVVMQKRIILYSINKIFGTIKGIEKIHIDDIIKLCNNNIGNKYLTPNKNLKIVTQKKQLKIMAVNI